MLVKALKDAGFRFGCMGNLAEGFDFVEKQRGLRI
jgi:hypothetical protein